MVSRRASSARPARRGRAVSEPHLLSVDALAAGGDGVARLADGRVVFVPRAAPGDRLEVAVDLASQPLRGRLLRVIEPGPGRVEPSCPHVDACGGCDWMHLSAPAQEAAHAAIARDAIARATRLSDLPEVRVHRATSPLGYRSRARFYILAPSTHQVRAGYRVGGAHKLAEVSSCEVLDARLGDVLAELRVLLRGSVGQGDAQVALGERGLPVVELSWRGSVAAATYTALDAVVRDGIWAGIRLWQEDVAVPAVFGDPRVWMTGADGEPLLVAPGGFAQPSSIGATALAIRVAELASLGEGLARRPARVVELFSGSGTLSVLLARGAGSFVGVEQDGAAVACARDNLAARGLAAKLHVADADAFAIPQPTDVIVLDPPRTGARGASQAIAGARAKVVVYVSCDPPTLARDLATLTAGRWSITDIETFELFPQTSHVETVVRLARDA